jgi:hypothetical protein
MATATAKLTETQREILDWLRDHDPEPLTPGHCYGGSCASLARRGLLERIDRGFFRPQYRLTERGRMLVWRTKAKSPNAAQEGPSEEREQEPR